MTETESESFVIRSEFAMVEVRRVRRASGDVLEIADVPGGNRVQLDALELEALCSLAPDLLPRLRNPEWRMSDESTTEST